MGEDQILPPLWSGSFVVKLNMITRQDATTTINRVVGSKGSLSKLHSETERAIAQVLQAVSSIYEYIK